VNRSPANCVVTIVGRKHGADPVFRFSDVWRAVGNHEKSAEAEFALARPFKCIEVLISVYPSVVLRSLPVSLELEFNGTRRIGSGKRTTNVEVFASCCIAWHPAFQIHQELIPTLHTTKLAVGCQNMGEVVLKRRFKLDRIAS
jgi:hypothetical protein